jgi:3-deoxy-7-phosphoheptulonate synthase
MIIEVADSGTIPAVQRLLQSTHEVRKLVFSRRYFVACSGDERAVDQVALKKIDGVLNIVDTNQHPYYFASRTFKEKDTVVRVGDVEIGGPRVLMIAGPCAVENLEDTLETAIGLAATGVQIVRGGAFKPRTTPYNFQGLGLEGLKILAEVRRRTGLKVVTEVISPEDVEIAAEYVDMLQVGMFNMTNTPLLKRLGRVGKPVILKRNAYSTLANLLKAAEFIIYNGNPHVILCERGVKTQETATRFTLDVSAVPVLKRLSHLPVIVDPSHAAGHRDLVPILSKCSVVAGADALLIESHIARERMIKPGDADQALHPSEVHALMKELQPIAEAIGRTVI